MGQLYDNINILIENDDHPYLKQYNITKPKYRHGNYIYLAFFSFLFCCPIFGVAGMHYADCSNRAYKNGDFEEARKKSILSQTMIVFALVSGLIIGFVIIIIFSII